MITHSHKNDKQPAKSVTQGTKLYSSNASLHRTLEKVLVNSTLWPEFETSTSLIKRKRKVFIQTFTLRLILIHKDIY
jgi:hypothetical protein